MTDSSFQYSLVALKAFTGDDPERLKTFIQVFLQSARKNGQMFEQAIREQKPRDISDLAHKMLTMYTQLEATEIIQLLRLIEKTGDSFATEEILITAQNALRCMNSLMAKIRADFFLD